MKNLFDAVPPCFFNCLSGASHNRIYADCLQVIYAQYDREISYRIPRNRIRDALAAYLLENHIESVEDEAELNDAKSYNDLAGGIIRRFGETEIGWLEEDSDESTYEKQIIMTEAGILLAEFLQGLIKPEREEFSSYIYNIYNILRNEEQWSQNPYVDCLKNIYRNARLLSKALKRLSTFIKRIIERMVREETLESLTENILEYCGGSFIREYERLTKQQNIHLYRSYIKSRLDYMQSDERLSKQLLAGCAAEEEIRTEDAAERVADMLQAAKRFLSYDYDRIMQDIKHKINLYFQIAVGRARFLRNHENDIRGNVEQTIRYIVEEMEAIGWKDELPKEMQEMFLLEKNEFIDAGSLRFPRKSQTVKEETVVPFALMTDDDIEKARQAHTSEAYNPYAKEKMKAYLDRIMAGKQTIRDEEIPIAGKRDLLCVLSAVAYGKENGYLVRLLDGYREIGQMRLRKFEITREG